MTELTFRFDPDAPQQALDSAGLQLTLLAELVSGSAEGVDLSEHATAGLYDLLCAVRDTVEHASKAMRRAHAEPASAPAAPPMPSLTEPRPARAARAPRRAA